MKDIADAGTTSRKLQDEGKVIEGAGDKWMTSKSSKKSAL